MKIFTNKNVVQKILIVLIFVILFNFTVPKPVSADAGGILMSPIVQFAASILDAIQHVLEKFMLGETAKFMKDIGDEAVMDTGEGEAGQITVDDKIDGSLFELGSAQIPKIQYTPEEIFSNRVPGLDINFIKPSVTGSDEVEERNIAMKLQNVIASWYVAIRTLAIVGLLSVLVYLGIRMLLTSVAADRAKYKKMIFDWVVAMCLVFALHYIMSFALTMSETVTSMISSDLGKTLKVTATAVDGQSGNVVFYSNFMSYIRFMIQCTDLDQKLGFLFLYLMLVIYTIRFTWVYLKRVVNMAFLTLIAPVVAFTYPIDKVSDGKAQAFNMWIKEFTFNALLQPLHLLLYTILLGSAVQLATDNPLYAIVCLGFIIAGEKLLKKMFGFEKASGGTVGSLAGAAGVTALAGQALNNFAKRGQGASGGGKDGKVRTNDTQRTKSKSGANSGLDAFNNPDAQPVPSTGALDSENTVPQDSNSDNTDNQNDEKSIDEQILEEQQNMSEQDYKEAGFESPEQWREKRRQELEAERANNNQAQEKPDTTGSPIPNETEEKLKQMKEPGFFKTVTTDTANFGKRIGNGAKNAYASMTSKEAWKNRGKKFITGVRKNAIGAWKAAPTVAYKAARGTLKTASRVAAGAALAATAGVIGATTGDGDKAMSMALGAGTIGLATGDNMFEATAGKVIKDKSVRDSFGAGKYGSAIDARNEAADKRFLKSTEFDEYYDKYFKGKKSKKEVKEAYKSYRESGITDNDTIRKAMKLEDEYAEKTGGKSTDYRKQVQNIVQTKDDIDKKAYSDSKVKETELKKLESVLTSVAPADRRKMAESIFKGYEDFRRISL